MITRQGVLWFSTTGAQCVGKQSPDDGRLRYNIANSQQESQIKAEDSRNQVGNVAAFKAMTVKILRNESLQFSAEVVDATIESRGVEGHINAGDDDDGFGLADLFSATLRFSQQGSKPGLRSSHRVLTARNVEVNDFKEFTTGLGNRLDEADDVGFGNSGAMWTQGGKAIIRLALGITRHQSVHCESASVHNFHNGLQ